MALFGETMPLMGASNAADEITFPSLYSARFNDDDSANLSWTPSGTGDRTRVVWSGFVKRGNLGSIQGLYGAFSDGANYSELAFNASDQLYFANFVGNVDKGAFVTSRVFRDTASWYHIVLVINTNEGTAADRIKLYVNGVQETDFDSSTNADSAGNMWYNHTVQQRIGFRGAASSGYFDGELTGITVLDGQSSITSSNFGEYSTNGYWRAKNYSGSYGTNGYKLYFETSSAFGDDTSGNTNDFANNAFQSTDQLLDTPAANYSVFNYLNKNGTLSDGNLTIASLPATNTTTPTTFGIPPNTGKWYWEVLVNSTTSYNTIGASYEDSNLTSENPSSTSHSFARATHTGATYDEGVSTGITIGTLTSTDYCMFAYDSDTGTVWMGKNGTWENSATQSEIENGTTTNAIVTGITKTIFPSVGVSNASGGGGFTFRAGQTGFSGTKPSGYKDLNTSNLPDPVIKKPKLHFDIDIYTGTSAANTHSVFEFSPGLVYLKNRSDTDNWNLIDSNRGATIEINPDISVSGETIDSNGLTAFTANGYTLGTSTTYNQTAENYVAYAWKTGTKTVSTTAQVSTNVAVNTTGGISVFNYTGTGTSNTVAHDLGNVPALIFVKKRNGGQGDVVYHKNNTTAPETDYLQIVDNGGTSDLNTIWNDTAPTSSVFTIGTDASINQSSSFSYMGFAFAEIEGFSRFGNWTTNNSTTGKFIYCGFRPKLVILKITSTTGAWNTFDTLRNLYNPTEGVLFLDTSGTEDTSTTNYVIDIVSNGFVLKSTNADINPSGSQTAIFMAFAEIPFKYALAR